MTVAWRFKGYVLAVRGRTFDAVLSDITEPKNSDEYWTVRRTALTPKFWAWVNKAGVGARFSVTFFESGRWRFYPCTAKWTAEQLALVKRRAHKRWRALAEITRNGLE